MVLALLGRANDQAHDHSGLVLLPHDVVLDRVQIGEGADEGTGAGRSRSPAPLIVPS